MDDVPSLLLALERMVRADPRGPGFVGTVAVGVELAMSTAWWVARCNGDTIETRFSDTRPAADAWLLFDEHAAEAAVRGRGASGPRFGGDLAVVERLSGRYSPGLSWLQRRARGAS